MPGGSYTHFLRCSATGCTTFSLITEFSSWVIFILWQQLHKQTRTSSISGEFIGERLSLIFVWNFVGDRERNPLLLILLFICHRTPASEVFHLPYRISRVQLFKHKFTKKMESLPWNLWTEYKYFQGLWHYVLTELFRIRDLNIFHIMVKISCYFDFALDEDIFPIKIM